MTEQSKNNLSDEYEYLNLLNKVLEDGTCKDDRTGTGTISLFGTKMEFDISETIPILTTKKVFYQSVIKELLWFISGETTTKFLKKNKVTFWDANTSREFLDKKGLTHFEEGELGAGYGFQWRHFGTEYKGPHENYQGCGVDQLQEAINLLKNDPFSRRIIVSAWNPSDLDKVALPPCHCFFQFNCVEIDGEKYLDCLLYQRSGDMFLGVPFNIASYSILTYMIASLVDMKPRKFVHMIGDTHIYTNHIEQVKQQLEREPYPFPTLKINKDVKNIDDFKFSDFELVDYKCHPYISGAMAV